MIKKLRFVLSLELIAYYFAAPYIILLTLDDKRGLFDSSFSAPSRMWCYAIMLGIYSLLQSIVAPSVGRRLDKKCSKISVLRNIHLANCTCYALLALATYLKSFFLALVGLSIPAIVGCAAPVGKSLISSLTDANDRTREFATLHFIKGIVKLCAPLVGAFIFTKILHESLYTPLFLLSSAISFSCFLYSFTFKNLVCPPTASHQCPTLSFFGNLLRSNLSLVVVFVMLLTGYLVFVKYIPFVVFKDLSNNPSIVNYFSAVVGLAYCINQFVVVRFTKEIESHMTKIFVLLSISCISFTLSTISFSWYMWVFTTLFSFSVLATCVEARLSLQPQLSSPGMVQGVLYSVENWCYLLAPFIGSTLASINLQAPLYFVIAASFVAHLGFRTKEFTKVLKSS